MLANPGGTNPLSAREPGPVYEGKPTAGLIYLVRDGEIPGRSSVLYAHLGGQPALNAYSAIFR
jgi:1-aminocyclopropane-1-carboxylate deaminase